MSYRSLAPILVSSLAVILVVPDLADAALVLSESPDLAFTASGPAGLSIVGKTSDFTVADHEQGIKVNVGLSNLSTGIGLRDKHMKEKYLEVQKYPNAELQVERSALNLPGPGQDTSADADGTLSLHGQTHPVKFHYKAKREGDKYSVQGTMHLNMRDYGIAVPSYLGITVKPDVDVAVKFDAVDQ
jgi:polyisoprenoid-binding protein YceI